MIWVLVEEGTECLNRSRSLAQAYICSCEPITGLSGFLALRLGGVLVNPEGPPTIGGPLGYLPVEEQCVKR